MEASCGKAENGIGESSVATEAKPVSVWVVIPAFNEATTIHSVVRPLVRAGYSVVVVDDASRDGTFAALSQSGVFYCRHLHNLGQGAALQTGIRFALQCDARYIVTFDADGQHSAEDVPRLLEPLQRGHSDVVLGSRFCRGGRAENIPWSRRTLLWAATWFTRMTTRMRVSDTHNGLRAFTAQAASKIHITHNRMSHATEILQQIHRLGLRYVEVPVTIRYTAYSRAKGQSAGQAIVILSDMVKGVLKS